MVSQTTRTAEIGVADVHVHAAQATNGVRVCRGGSLKIPVNIGASTREETAQQSGCVISQWIDTRWASV